MHSTFHRQRTLMGNARRRCLASLILVAMSLVTSSAHAADDRFTRVFSDDFNGGDLGPVWLKYGYDEDWPGHAGNGLRVARAVSVHDGIAEITAREVNGTLESGAFMMNEPAYQLTYGRYETRVRVDEDPSRTMAGVVLLWNKDDSSHAWYEGEDDIWETGTDRDAWYTFLHYRDATSKVSCTHHDPDGSPSDPSLWHDVAAEWTPSRLQVFVDGRAEDTCTWTDPRVIPDWRQRLTFQLDAQDPDMGSAVVRMQVDYARIYALASATRCTRPPASKPSPKRRAGSRPGATRMRCAARHP
jgi:hypothetical protein